MKFYRAGSSIEKLRKRDGFVPFRPLPRRATIYKNKKPVIGDPLWQLIEFLIGSRKEVDHIDINDPLTSRYARNLIKIKEYNITKNKKILKKGVIKKNLGELPRVIVPCGAKDSHAFWCSMSLDPGVKGQAKGRTIYEFSMDMWVYKWSKGTSRLVKTTKEEAIKSRTPHLLFDKRKEHIALLHSQDNGECEVSFFTKIPLALLKPMESKTPPEIPAKQSRPPGDKFRTRVALKRIPPPIPNKMGRPFKNSITKK